MNMRIQASAWGEFCKTRDAGSNPVQLVIKNRELLILFSFIDKASGAGVVFCGQIRRSELKKLSAFANSFCYIYIFLKYCIIHILKLFYFICWPKNPRTREPDSVVNIS